ncbi:hypothetical protein EVAR_50307_1, partial [Eumeta japonica]
VFIETLPAEDHIDGCEPAHKVYQVPYIFGPFEPYSATDAVQDAQNKIEDSATELQRRHRSTNPAKGPPQRHLQPPPPLRPRPQPPRPRATPTARRPPTRLQKNTAKHHKHIDEPVPVAPTDSGRPTVGKRKSTCNSRKRTHRIAKAKEELLRTGTARSSASAA